MCLPPGQESSSLADEYGFGLRMCRPYRAKTKGKVERFNGSEGHLPGAAGRHAEERGTEARRDRSQCTCGALASGPSEQLDS